MTPRKQYLLKLFGLSSLMVLVLFPLSLWFFYQSYLSNELDIETASLRFNVPPKSNLYQVAEELAQMQVLEYPRLLVWHARLNDLTLVQTGEYELSPGLTPPDLLRMLNTGDVVTYTATIPEGLRFSDMRDILESNPLLIADTQGLDEQELLEFLGLETGYLEGWFYPDTYVFSRQTAVSEILKQAHRQTLKSLQSAWSQRDIGIPLSSPEEVLIMASLVEKETGVDYERPEIAGVFIRRLQKNMKLQTDPTVIYAMGETYDGNIRRSDLNIDSPYNTYRYRGLPPTPIALVGEEALLAAVQPQAGSSLYFVAKGDGSHYFSDTLEEHNQAVRRYQIEKRRSDYRSSPQP